jgi:diguanylate cyclase (GGDEF)-like protein
MLKRSIFGEDNSGTFTIDGEYVTSAIARFLDLVMIVGAAGLGFAGLVQGIVGYNYPFVAINGSGMLLFTLLYLWRTRVPNSTKLAIISLYMWMQILVSLLNSGLLGTSEILIALFIVITVVVLRPVPGIAVSLAAVLTMFIFAYLLKVDAVSFTEQAAQRNAMPVHWAVQGMALAFFALFIIGIINYFRTTLLSTIHNLRASNEDLRSLNQQLETRKNQIAKLAYYDRFTGLPNRINFKLLVLDRIASGVSSAYMVYLDVKNFRIVNALYGNRYGDRVLQSVGSSFRSEMNSVRYVARLGSDEFAMWIEDLDAEELAREIERFTAHASANATAENGLNHTLDFYCAAARFPADGNNYQECARAASLALRMAKEKNSADVLFFAPHMSAYVEYRQEIRRLLQRAVENSEFTVAYQSKVNIRSHEIVGVEALARWAPAELSPIGPEEFIPYLDEWELIVPFTKLILEQVLDDIPGLQELHSTDLKVSVNISPIVFLNTDFVTWVEEALRQRRLSPEILVFEITEDVFVDDFSRIKQVFTSLRNLGIGISLDDFGKGYSSLSYLSALEFTELKVDRQFIEHIATSKKKFQLFQSICSIAETYGYKVVAEGVENEEQARTLLRTSCTIGQGFYYSHPAPLRPLRPAPAGLLSGNGGQD